MAAFEGAMAPDELEGVEACGEAQDRLRELGGLDTLPKEGLPAGPP